MSLKDLLAIDYTLHEGLKAMADDVRPHLVRAYRRHGEATLRAFRAGGEARDLIRSEAIKYARSRGAELVTNLSDSTKTMVGEQLARAIKYNWTVPELRDAMSKWYGFSPERAEVIARTELTMAYRRGGRVAASAGGAEQKSWDAADDACEDCLANQAAGWIAIDDEFPSGDAPHPSCRCEENYRTTEDEDEDDEADSDIEAASAIPSGQGNPEAVNLKLDLRGGSEPFRHAVRRTVAIMPIGAKILLRGWTIETVDRADGHWVGTTEPDHHHITIAEMWDDGDMITDVAQVVRHEVGHAAAAAIQHRHPAWWRSWRVISTKETAKKKDALIRNGFEYVLKTSEETFAEFFSLELKHPEDPEDEHYSLLKRILPHCNDLMQSLIKPFGDPRLD